MKLQIEGVVGNPVANIGMRHDANDVNLTINGLLVAYFEVRNDKVSLQLMRVPSAVRNVIDVDSEGFIKVAL